MKINKLIISIIVSLILGLLLGLWAKYIATPWYTSNALIETTEKEYESSLSQLISSANPFGGFASSPLAQSFNPGAALKRKITTVSFLKDLDPNKDFLKKLYPENWDSENNIWLEEKSYNDLRQFLILNLFLDYDTSTELVEVSLMTNSRSLSQDLLTSILNQLNDSEKYRVAVESANLISLASEYLDKDRSIFSKEIYTGIIESETRRKLVAETRENLILRTLDFPSLPISKSKPRGTYYAIFGFIISFLSLLTFFYIRPLYTLLFEDLKKLNK